MLFQLAQQCKKAKTNIRGILVPVPVAPAFSKRDLESSIMQSGVEHLVNGYYCNVQGRHKYLLWKDGCMTAYCGMTSEPIDVISGPFSGCVMALIVFTDGRRSVFHIHTSKTDNDRRGAWERYCEDNRADIQEIWTFNPSRESKFAEAAVKAADPRMQCYGIVESDKQCYIIHTTMKDNAEYIVYASRSTPQPRAWPAL